jgi:hypothetical protein
MKIWPDFRLPSAISPSRVGRVGRKTVPGRTDLVVPTCPNVNSFARSSISTHCDSILSSPRLPVQFSSARYGTLLWVCVLILLVQSTPSLLRTVPGSLSPSLLPIPQTNSKMPKLSTITTLLLHPTDLRAIISFYLYRDPLTSIEDIPEESGWNRTSMRRCWKLLDLTSRSFAMVIKELEGELGRVVSSGGLDAKR